MKRVRGMHVLNINELLDKFVKSPTYVKSHWCKTLEPKGEDYCWYNHKTIVKPLNESEKTVLMNSDKTLVQIGRILDRSPERVRQIKFRASLKLMYMREHNPHFFSIVVKQLEEKQ